MGIAPSTDATYAVGKQLVELCKQGRNLDANERNRQGEHHGNG